MFSDLILRNSRRGRRENGLFFGSLIVSIAAFYVILSISYTDIMAFLSKVESDAVQRLLSLIPAFYAATLVILFFLIFFASRYQMECRSHELGVYLMLGMRRGKLFFMLLAEDMLSSGFALLIGLPAAILLSEVISLVSAKLVGIGIIGHRFTVSLSAVLLTVGGFLLVRLTASFLLSGKFCRREIGGLLNPTVRAAKKRKPAPLYAASFILGVALLIAAYREAILGDVWEWLDRMALTLAAGMLGTFLLFYGMSALVDLLWRWNRGDSPLSTFNYRQVRGNVMFQPASLATGSLLILAALCCFGAGIGIAGATGIGIAGANGISDAHVPDYTFESYEDISPEEVFPKVLAALREGKMEGEFSELFPMRLGYARTAEGEENAFHMDGVRDALLRFPWSEARDRLLNELEAPYLICLSDYNKLLELAGKPALHLERNEAAVYVDPSCIDAERTAMLNEVFAAHPKAGLGENQIFLTGKIQNTNMVTDSSVTLAFALILPDGQFFRYFRDNYTVYVNGVLKKDAVKKNGLATAVSAMNDRLDEMDISALKLRYESYLNSFGRQLLFIVASSYITIYLASILMVVANTVLGIQFLMNQQKACLRYRTLVRLGVTYEALCDSARTQIAWHFGLPVAAAGCSSIFGVISIFHGFLPSSIYDRETEMLAIAAVVILLLLMVEWAYIRVIRHSSDRYLLTLMRPRREE